MEVINKPTWPMSWREKMSLMEVGESIPVDEKVVKSVRYIASKYHHSKKSGSKKRFTVKKDPDDPGKWRLWRKDDHIGEQGGTDNDKFISGK